MLKDKLISNADLIIKELIDCESYQLGNDSEYNKQMAKISAYNYLIELLGVKGEVDEAII